jgi:transcriptional regulator with XRE-family HTH domain
VDQLNPPMIGKNINLHRNRLKISLDTLSKRSGVSKSMLSQIEQDKTNPTIVTVWKIARAIGLTVQDLMEPSTNSIEVTRFNDLPVIHSIDKLCEIRIDSPVHMTDNLELYHFTLMPGGKHVSKPHYPSEEFLTVIDGKVLVQSGDFSVILNKGDTSRYRGDLDHSVENVDQGISQVYVIVLFAKE